MSDEKTIHNDEQTYLAGELLSAVRHSMHEAVAAKLTGYQSPLEPLLKVVVERHRAELEKMLEAAFVEAYSNTEVRAQIVEGVRHKIGRELVNKMGGEVEKQVNLLKSNPETRAKITLAIAEIVRGTSL